MSVRLRSSKFTQRSKFPPSPTPPPPNKVQCSPKFTSKVHSKLPVRCFNQGVDFRLKSFGISQLRWLLVLACLRCRKLLLKRRMAQRMHHEILTYDENSIRNFREGGVGRGGSGRADGQGEEGEER